MEKNRQRLTITLRQEILDLLDKNIDGSRIRNRSHAIEYILSKHFSRPIDTAIILAGGKGIKMRPATYETPKAMLTINNRPFLEYTIDNFRRHGIRKFIISIGYLGKKIKNHFGDGSKFGVKITYIEQGKHENGTSEPIRQAQKILSKKPFFLYYGDVLANIDITDMIDFHVANDAVVTMALTSIKEPHNWGVVRLQGSKVYSFLEKPSNRKDLSHLINSGIYICDPQIFKYINTESKRLEKDVFPKLVNDKELNGYLFAGQWFDAGNPEIFKYATKKWEG